MEKMNRQMHDMKPSDNSPSPPHPLFLPSKVFSHPLKPLVWSFCQIHQNDKQVQLHKPGCNLNANQAEVWPLWPRRMCLAPALLSLFFCPLTPFQDLPSSLLQCPSEGKLRAVCAWCERYVNKPPFNINSTSKYYQIMLLTLPAGKGLHLEIISSNWEASKVPFPRQRVHWPWYG